MKPRSEPTRCDAAHPWLMDLFRDSEDTVGCTHQQGHSSRHVAVYADRKTLVSWDQEKEDE